MEHGKHLNVFDNIANKQIECKERELIVKGEGLPGNRRSTLHNSADAFNVHTVGETCHYFYNYTHIPPRLVIYNVFFPFVGTYNYKIIWSFFNNPPSDLQSLQNFTGISSITRIVRLIELWISIQLCDGTQSFAHKLRIRLVSISLNYFSFAPPNQVNYSLYSNIMWQTVDQIKKKKHSVGHMGGKSQLLQPLP